MTRDPDDSPLIRQISPAQQHEQLARMKEMLGHLPDMSVQIHPPNIERPHVIEFAREPLASWISVAARLPLIRKRVDVWREGPRGSGERRTDAWLERIEPDGYLQWFDDCETNLNSDGTVTHWMPIPSPP